MVPTGHAYRICLLNSGPVGNWICKGQPQFNNVCNESLSTSININGTIRSDTSATCLHAQHDICGLVKRRIASGDVSDQRRLEAFSPKLPNLTEEWSTTDPLLRFALRECLLDGFHDDKSA